MTENGYHTMKKRELLERLRLSDFRVIQVPVKKQLGLTLKEVKRKRKFYPREVRLLDEYFGLYK